MSTSELRSACENPSTARGNLLRLILQTIIAAAMSIGAWFAKEVWEGQKRQIATAEERFVFLSGAINQINTQQAVVAANRFTSNDWVTAKSVLDSRDNELSQRVSLMERDFSTMQKNIEKIGAGVEGLTQRFYTIDFSRLPKVPQP